jgi:hypothetical protein
LKQNLNIDHNPTGLFYGMGIIASLFHLITTLSFILVLILTPVICVTLVGCIFNGELVSTLKIEFLYFFGSALTMVLTTFLSGIANLLE